MYGIVKIGYSMDFSLLLLLLSFFFRNILFTFFFLLDFLQMEKWIHVGKLERERQKKIPRNGRLRFRRLHIMEKHIPYYGVSKSLSSFFILPHNHQIFLVLFGKNEKYSLTNVNQTLHLILALLLLHTKLLLPHAWKVRS